MNFSQALDFIKQSKKAFRIGWNEKNISIHLYKTDINLTTKECIYRNTVDGYFIPWTATQEDILANDWVIL